MNKFIFWIKGYVHASIPTKNAERFINIMRAQSIRAFCFYIKDERCHFQISKNDYRLLLPLARKTSSYPRIHKKSGGYYIGLKLIQHTGLLLGIVCFFVLMYIMSQFLWKVEFDGNNLHTEEQLMHFLEKNNVGFGTCTKNISCTGLESELRKEFEDISWASVELKGSRLIVRVKESFLPMIESNQNGKYHIVAEQNGIVTEIITRKGTPKVMVGDSVKKGDILIQGVIETINEYDELIDRETVCADGDVTIKADINYQDSVPLLYKQKRMTGEQKNGYSLSFMNKKIFSYMPSIPYESYDIITTSVTWKISDNLYLPISHNTISCMEYIEEEARYSDSQLTGICYQRYLDAMEAYLAFGYQIIDEQVELQISEDVCCLQGTVTLEGPFWHRTEIIPDISEGITAE